VTRSPLAYPLNRSADMDAGGAADLQTDIMRFMAIISLCLVAIFALVQSIPLTPAEPMQTVETVEIIEPVAQSQVIAINAAEKDLAPAAPPQPPVAASLEKRAEAAVSLTRPKWQPKYIPANKPAETTSPENVVSRVTSAATPITPVTEAVPPVEPESEGFTLRFESDATLSRLVASNRIGLYAVADGRAQRMTVSESRISFWDASTPNTYHEMETQTVPAPVIDALTRTGTSSANVSWGVTLPGKLKTQLDELMLEHRGGSLIIVASGDIQWEAT